MATRIERVEFACGVCAAVYQTLADAVACESKPKDSPVVAVGDIVLCRAGFGWYDGDRRWIENYAALGEYPKTFVAGKPKRVCPNGDGNCFSPCCTYQFYYVVSKLDTDPKDPHRARYHLYTGAMTCGHREGYTFNEGHFQPRYVVPQPSEIVELGKAFVGNAAGYLL